MQRRQRLLLASVLVSSAQGCKGHTREHTAERTASTAAKGAPSALAPSLSPLATAPESIQAKVSEPVRVQSTAAVARLYAKTRFVWVYPEPDATLQWIGFLRSGSSVRVRHDAPRAGNGCDAFYAIEPRGYVCGDGRRATLSAEDPVVKALEPFRAQGDSAWPHRYGESLGLARYFSTPTEALQKLREGDLKAHLRDVAEARAGHVSPALQGVDVSLPEQGPIELPELPLAVYEDRKELKRRSTVAYSTEARFGERAFLLSSDFSWVPKDRVKPYPEILFHGVRLGVDAKLPLAFFRSASRPQFRRDASGAFAPTGAAFSRLEHVELSGESARFDGQRYLETRTASLWLRESDAVLPTPRGVTPWGASVGAEDTTGRAPKGRATWIEVSIDGGWLLAFEGTRAVYATLISPGRGGVAKDGEDPLARAATPTGAYPISGKFMTATMEAPGELIHSDVPFAQNIVGPYALHAAYWHDNWGNPQSGGCINLSPLDAKWMFDFSDPKLPEGWHGVRWVPSEGPATLVVLHR